MLSILVDLPREIVKKPQISVVQVIRDHLTTNLWGIELFLCWKMRVCLTLGLVPKYKLRGDTHSQKDPQNWVGLRLLGCFYFFQ